MRVIFSLLLCALSLSAYGQNTAVLPATIMSGMGTPSSNSIACNAGVANTNTGSLYIQRDITIGNAIWKCVLLPDGVTYSWVAPFVSPVIGAGTTVSIGGSLLILNGTVSGTATVTGAVVGSNCVATRSDGSLPIAGMIIDCAVSTANTVTVRLTALIAGTPSATTYNVRVIL